MRTPVLDVWLFQKYTSQQQQHWSETVGSLNHSGGNHFRKKSAIPREIRRGLYKVISRKSHVVLFFFSLPYDGGALLMGHENQLET
jgi:hypothetical protein